MELSSEEFLDLAQTSIIGRVEMTDDPQRGIWTATGDLYSMCGQSSLMRVQVNYCPASESCWANNRAIAFFYGCHTREIIASQVSTWGEISPNNRTHVLTFERRKHQILVRSKDRRASLLWTSLLVYLDLKFLELPLHTNHSALNAFDAFRRRLRQMNLRLDREEEAWRRSMMPVPYFS